MLGFMNTPQMGTKMPAGVIWAADNGRFNAPHLYSDDRYLGWLAKQPVERCLFATAPDVLANHAATVELSMPLFPLLRALGYRAAFVVQDGWCEDDTPWDKFEALFVGGTTKFKLGRASLAIAAASVRGKWIHMGRVNSFARLRVAAALGCNSADGTFLKFAPDINEPRMLRWFDQLLASPLLPLFQRGIAI